MLKYLCVLFILGACSSSKFKKIQDVDTKDVEKKFELTSGELDKFLITTQDSGTSSRLKRLPHKKLKKWIKTKKATSSYKYHSYKKKMTSNKDKKKKNIPEVKPVMLDQKSKSKVSVYPKKFINFDKRSKLIWQKYKPNIYIGEEAKFKVKYLGITAGFITLTTLPVTQLNGEAVYHFKAGVKTANYYSMIYWLNDSIHSYIRVKDFLPLKYILAQREKKQDIDDLQLFDRQKMQTLFLFYKKKKGKEQRKHIIKPIPYYFQDSFSSIFFLRGLNPQVGDSFEYPIVNKARYWILTMKVEAKEQLDIMGKKVEALRVSAETHFPGVLKKSGDIFFWFSTDEDHRLLKFKGEVKIGSINGELISFKQGEKLEAR